MRRPRAGLAALRPWPSLGPRAISTTGSTACEERARSTKVPFIGATFPKSPVEALGVRATRSTPTPSVTTSLCAVRQGRATARPLRGASVGTCQVSRPGPVVRCENADSGPQVPAALSSRAAPFAAGPDTVTLLGGAGVRLGGGLSGASVAWSGAFRSP